MPRPDLALAAALERAATQHGAISRTQARAAGLTPSRLLTLTRSGGWENPVRGAYVVPGSGPAGDAHAALLTWPGGVLCGITAARLHGLAAGSREVHLLLPATLRRARRRGVVTHWTRTGLEIVAIDGLPVTDLARTLADCMLWSARDEAVCLLDGALRSGRLSSAYLPVLGGDIARRYGGRIRAGWCALADAQAESPLETRLRLVLVDAGLRAEATQ